MLRICGSPKFHKEGVPIRPTINTIGSPTYHLHKFLVKKKIPMTSSTSSYIKDSSSFVKWIKNQEVKE